MQDRGGHLTDPLDNCIPIEKVKILCGKPMIEIIEKGKYKFIGLAFDKWSAQGAECIEKLEKLE